VTSRRRDLRYGTIRAIYSSPGRIPPSTIFCSTLWGLPWRSSSRGHFSALLDIIRYFFSRIQFQERTQKQMVHFHKARIIISPLLKTPQNAAISNTTSRLGARAVNPINSPLIVTTLNITFIAPSRRSLLPVSQSSNGSIARGLRTRRHGTIQELRETDVGAIRHDTTRDTRPAERGRYIWTRASMQEVVNGGGVLGCGLWLGNGPLRRI
jgi:hypothetical protein